MVLINGFKLGNWRYLEELGEGHVGIEVASLDEVLDVDVKANSSLFYVCVFFEGEERLSWKVREVRESDFEGLLESLKIRVSFSEGPFIVDEFHLNFEEDFGLASNQLFLEFIDLATNLSVLHFRFVDNIFIYLP
jgi:hypothetical protein